MIEKFRFPKITGEMCYESPIKVFQTEMQMRLEGAIMEAIQQYKIFVDKEELIKALNYDRNQYIKGFNDGYHGDVNELIKQITANVEKKMGDLETEAYIKGVEDLAERLIGYYSNIRGSTAAALVAFTVEEIKKETKEKKEREGKI